ncbi:hypothetical protein MNR01_15075 [Lysobacter sp. S4-A87]|uniref:hypothetical protein n=1 Tax=Lysobacter sp. S4-A87 TaxID=2925843 RepID=UPI001F532E6D|nr:hypothetical protein [Lysobacter sp. S4-A87]UNK49040.1 hypothetical protein MNR01_15075 [Lysobacter sp. S4-A87]
MRSTHPHLAARGPLRLSALRLSVIRLSALRLLALAALLPLAGASLAQQKIEQQMTYEQFKAAGLDRLSPEQLANLNSWLNGKLEVETAKAAETAKQSSGEDSRGLAVAASREPVSGTITGTFSGFGKGRSFTLDNGQVWQQIDSASITGVKDANPKVKITPSLVGSAWYLSIEGFNTRAKVQRVK